MHGKKAVLEKVKGIFTPRSRFKSYNLLQYFKYLHTYTFLSTGTQFCSDFKNCYNLVNLNSAHYQVINNGLHHTLEKLTNKIC